MTIRHKMIPHQESEELIDVGVATLEDGEKSRTTREWADVILFKFVDDGAQFLALAPGRHPSRGKVTASVKETRSQTQTTPFFSFLFTSVISSNSMCFKCVAYN